MASLHSRHPVASAAILLVRDLRFVRGGFGDRAVSPASVNPFASSGLSSVNSESGCSSGILQVSDGTGKRQQSKPRKYSLLQSQIPLPNIFRLNDLESGAGDRAPLLSWRFSDGPPILKDFRTPALRSGPRRWGGEAMARPLPPDLSQLYRIVCCHSGPHTTTN